MKNPKDDLAKILLLLRNMGRKKSKKK